MTKILLCDIWNNLFESVVITDRNGGILKFNNNARRLFSLKSDSINNTSIFELLPGLKNTFNKRDTSLGVPISYGVKDLLVTMIPLNKYVVLTFENKTNKEKIKYSLDQLKEKVDTYEYVLDKLDEGVCIINNDRVLTSYNKKIGEINSRDPETIKDKMIHDAFPNLEEENSKLLKTLRLGKVLNHRETHFTKTGKEVTILSETYPIVLNNKQRGAVEIIKDITKQKELEKTIGKINKDNQTSESNLTTERKGFANNTRYTFNDIIYNSREMGRIVQQAKRAARFSSNVLIYGETGTGKELFAQSIHNESPRKNEKFIAQNCAAIPDNLLEGLLFGTTEGSFTGAVNRAGIFEQAEKGTLLLDEVNSISLNLQAKLLRVLQEKKVRRLGSDREIDFDVRVIATMNEDPIEAIKNGHLREDLYYRLSVVNLNIKPLRKRKVDIQALVNHFIDKHSNSLGIHVDGIENNVAEFFRSFPWPGNARQLEHTIEGALNFIYDETKITFDHLSDSFQKHILEDYSNHMTQKSLNNNLTHENLSLNERLESIETELIIQALKETSGNITEAGKILGISRQSLNYKLNKYELLADEYKHEVN